MSTMLIFCWIVVGQVMSCLHWSITLRVVTCVYNSILMGGLIICQGIYMVFFSVKLVEVDSYK